MMMPTARAQDTLGLEYAVYTEDGTLQGLILDVVDGIISQDSRDRGAWTRVVTKRIALDSLYTDHEVTREIGRMLKAGSLYESCREIRDGVFPMSYVRNGDELKGKE